MHTFVSGTINKGVMDLIVDHDLLLLLLLPPLLPTPPPLSIVNVSGIVNGSW